MTIQLREANKGDIPEIVSVLRASLGESKLPKSEKIWIFKHIENPFGSSLVLIAEEAGKVIGVRAFMKWKWQYGEKEFSTFRAVDTATHPDYQGKGIFKKLTLEAIERGVLNGDDFIFNTPNSQSLPGYLKMGWEKVGKLGVQLIPVNPFYWKFGNKSSPYKRSGIISKNDLEILTDRYNKLKIETSQLFTPKTAEYLYWRYENNPLQQYEVFSDKDIYLAAYVKSHRYFNELRVVEHIYTEDKSLKKIMNQVKSWSKRFGVQVISIGSDVGHNNFFKLAGNFGPMLTARQLHNAIPVNLNQLNNWAYSLGDVELF